MLQIKQLCVCEITEMLSLATATVSNHLKVLREAGFITEEKDGKWINYMINSKSINPQINSLLSLINFSANKDELTIMDKDKLRTISRHDICKG